MATKIKVKVSQVASRKLANRIAIRMSDRFMNFVKLLTLISHVYIPTFSDKIQTDVSYGEVKVQCQNTCPEQRTATERRRRQTKRACYP